MHHDQPVVTRLADPQAVAIRKNRTENMGRRAYATGHIGRTSAVCCMDGSA